MFEEFGNDIKLNTIHLKREGKNKVSVDITDSNTVHEQIEYLVYLNKLWEKSSFYPIRENTPLGNQPSDFILSNNEKRYSSLFVYGSAIHVEKKSNKVVYPLDKLYVSSRKGIPYEGKITASGDDKTEELSHILPNIKRIATLDNEKSLYHSILKILNQGYRDGDFKEREKLAQKLHDKLKGEQDLSNLSKILKYGFIVYEGSNKKKYGDKSIKKWINLNKNKDKSYEPIVYIDDDKMHGIFGNDSFLLK